ncbi:hypothetical protein STK_10710 [Sulfurisphaera tokodaii str. 7]|uniref:Uncharacterized protein n=2 Tax=Sulfurisphaera tokodaii TaxID=111955 RepID=F9VNU3_SULTO|nr:hypothetical protein [Sulfurisphaera tokodaii]BAK54451.1 hypothetical protein STK_10710 [Sulfurisphaera tokodaii str. 7]
MRKKALSNVISVIIVLIIILVIFVPLLIYYNSSLSSSVVSQQIVNNYIYLRNLQVNQVITGHPAFYYNGSSILVVYSNGTFVPPSNVTITSILYLNQNGVWQNITSLKYPIKLNQSEVLLLPTYVQNSPIIIVTSLGNIFFLQPNSSIGPVSFNGKAGVTILAQIYTKNGPIGVSTNITTNIMGTLTNYTTPIVFPNRTGTFVVRAPQYVYYQNSKGQIITGVFYNWIKLGSATINSTTTQGIKVTLSGSPLVLIANYTQITAQVTVTLESNYPGYVNVIVDGNSQTFIETKTVQVPAGFINITVLTIQGNYTSQTSSGIIRHYIYSNTTIQYGTQSSVYKATSLLAFIPLNTNPVVSINYKNNYNYYNVRLIAYYNKYNDNVSIGNVEYEYGTSPFIIGGNYTFVPIGTFTGYSTYGAVEVIFQYSNGTCKYYFPNIPGYVIINQPMTITVYYGTELYWQPLT